MDPAIVEDYDRTGTRECVHLVKEAIDELFEPLGIIGAFNDVESNDPTEGQCGED